MRKLGLAILAAGLLPVGAARAQVAVGLAASPQVAEVSVAPGGRATETVTVTNTSSASLNVVVAVGDVVASGNGFALESPGSTASSAAAWVTVTPASFNMGPADSTQVRITVRAPAGVKAGMHAAGILFDGGRGARVLHAVLVTATAPGLSREISVESIRMPSLETGEVVVFRLTVSNRGNTHAVIGGTIFVRDRLRRTDTAVAIPTLYVMPGRRTFTIEWSDPPPVVVARARADVTVRYESASGAGDVQSVSTTGLVIVYWAIALVIALALLAAWLLSGLVGRRRRRARRRRVPQTVPAKPTTTADLPPAVPGGMPLRAGARSAWESEPLHTSAAGAIAGRRAHAAIRLLRQGPGRSGVRPDVAIGLLRSVQEIPEVRRTVEAAYEEATEKGSFREAASLSLALAVVESPRAPEALLRAYAKADRVLAGRIRRALAQCDPADLRALPELMSALPVSRRDTLPVG